jgi:integrase/recombinase XerD
MIWMPCLVEFGSGSETPRMRLGHPLVDRYLEFVAARGRSNTLLATGYDLKVFFSVVAKDPVEVTTADIFEFITSQRGDRRVVRISDGGSGLSPRTIQRRLSTLSGLFSFLLARGDVAANPVPRGLATRSPRRSGRGAPLVRAPRTLPRILEPAEVDALVASLRTLRDRAMVEAMVLGGLRRNETLGLRLEDLKPGNGGCSFSMARAATLG